MAVLRKLARPLLAAPLITGGMHALRHPEAVAELAQPVARAIGERMPSLKLAADPLKLMRVNSAVQVGAGLLFATGRAPRLAALTLATTLVPNALAGHAFWNVEDKEERGRRRALFLTDLSVLGGLLIAAADTHGKPSLAYRSRHAFDHRHPVRAVRRSGKAAIAGNTGISGHF
ncbi:DoxX family membrane protein [Streptomyces sp. NPDC101733]|uniref:DoxX family membrane protein n=1 Tax=unclassified Streptomyces TaxID=2593676 RepID=UPI0037FFB2A2